MLFSNVTVCLKEYQASCRESKPRLITAQGTYARVVAEFMAFRDGRRHLTWVTIPSKINVFCTMCAMLL